MATFAEQLTAARKAAGMTQEELAGAVHVTRTTISSWERGRTRPDVDTLRLISGTLNWDFMADKTVEREDTVSPAAPAEPQPARRKWLIPAVIAAALILAVCFAVFVLPQLRPQAADEQAASLPPAAAVNLSPARVADTRLPRKNLCADPARDGKRSGHIRPSGGRDDPAHLARPERIQHLPAV